MRYQVPQFVDIEDKIIGPLTLKQFLLYLVTALLMIPVFLAADLTLFLTITIPAFAIAAAFAHVKIYGKSLFTMISNAALFVRKGQIFLWQRTGSHHPLPITITSTDTVMPGTVSALSEQAKTLATGGHLLTEDAADPLVATSEAV